MNRVSVGCSFGQAVAAMLPPAPGRFSTDDALADVLESFFTWMRAVMSVPPPGAKSDQPSSPAGSGMCPARERPAAASAMTAAEILSWFLPQFSPRLLKPPGSIFPGTAAFSSP